MNKVILSLIIVITGCSSGDYFPLDTVNSVNVDKYLGKWYEIARLPNRFQEDCFGTTAEYSLIDENTLKVVNSCYEDSLDGELDQANGKAFIVEGSNNSKLKVQFFWPFKGDYWIIALDKDDYSYSVVGTPSREYLWILARDNQMKRELFDSLKTVVSNKKFDVSKLIIEDNKIID